MSLQLAAQHMASRGRGPDTQLVHMAPQEVAGLQALAKAHGGSLTINPETGLAEAGFLKNLLPTLIGAGLSIASGGTLTPLMAAGITGAGYGVATGSLQKGLMAGLGAYGGAGLAGGLTAAAGTVGAGAANPLAGMEAAALENPAVSGFQAANAAPAAAATPGYNVMTGGFSGVDPLGLNPAVAQAAPAAAQGVSPVATATPMPTGTPVADRFSQAFQGVKNLGTEAGREAFMGNAASKGVAASGVGGGMGLMKSAYAAALPMMIQEPAKQGQKEEEKPYEYDFDYGPISNPGAGYTGAPTGERRFFNPRFTRRAADGGLMDLGTVQAMSDRNMAQTIAANGGRIFASGGSVRPVEEDPYYTMSGQSGDAFKYLMGQTPTPEPAAQAPSANTSGGTGFLAGITGIAGADGITNVNTGITAPWSASNPKPTVAGLFSDPNRAAPAGDTIEYDYTFDPITNRYSRTPKAVTPPAPVNPATGGDSGGGSYDGGGGYNPGGGGYDDSFYSGSGLGSNNAPVENMGTDLGFGDPSFSGITGEVGTEGGYGGGSEATEGGYTGEVGTEGGYYGAKGGIAALAQGGPSHLGDYSDGGRLLRGPGDGVSDSIPATIANKRPARLADGEFVVPARIVSELGNGSTEAGARKLYAMMDRIQKARKKSIGKNRVAVNSKTEKMLPA